MIISFHGDLPALLPRPLRGQAHIEASLGRRTSSKDLVESYDVPHTEVGRLTINGCDIDFCHIVDDTSHLEVYPPVAPLSPLRPTLLRPQPLPRIAFAVDQNVGRLAPLLRMVGFDAYFQHGIADPDLAELAWRDQRILLSKDKDLLKRKKVLHGRLIREIFPARQLLEVLDFFGLKGEVEPFSRCLRCNDGVLEEIAKERILDYLQPLTIKYYNEFYRCNRCGKIFWPGTHLQRMTHLLARLDIATADSGE